MKALILALGTLFATAGCNQIPGHQDTPAAVSNKSAVAPADAPVQFELRDFRLDKETSTVGPTYKGRGTIVTKDPRLASGSFYVFLTAKQAHANDDEERMQVLLTDGIGTIETYDYLPSDEKNKDVKYYDWKVLGYIPLLKGRMITPTSENAAPQS